jgi:hypothetical protein
MEHVLPFRDFSLKEVFHTDAKYLLFDPPKNTRTFFIDYINRNDPTGFTVSG